MNLSKLGIRGSRKSTADGILQEGAGHRCPKRACRELLRIEVLPGGKTVAICDPCERNKRWLCRLCPRPLACKGKTRGNAQFCVECRRKHRKRYRQGWHYANHAETLADRKRYYRENREARIAYAGRYRAAHPVKRDDLDRKYHREWSRNAWKDPAYRAKEAKRRGRIRVAKRKAAVLAGQVVKLTPRDRQWLLEAGVLPISGGSLRATGTAPQAGRRTPGTVQRSAVA